MLGWSLPAEVFHFLVEMRVMERDKQADVSAESLIAL